MRPPVRYTNLISHSNFIPSPHETLYSPNPQTFCPVEMKTNATFVPLEALVQLDGTDADPTLTTTTATTSQAPASNQESNQESNQIAPPSSVAVPIGAMPMFHVGQVRRSEARRMDVRSHGSVVYPTTRYPLRPQAPVPSPLSLLRLPFLHLASLFASLFHLDCQRALPHRQCEHVVAQGNRGEGIRRRGGRRRC